MMLFARLRSDDRAFAFLGPATYANTRASCPWQLPGGSTIAARRPVRNFRSSGCVNECLVSWRPFAWPALAIDWPHDTAIQGPVTRDTGPHVPAGGKR